MTTLEEVLRQIVREELRAVLSERDAARQPAFARELSLAEAARHAGRSVRTLREWIRSGMLPSTQIARGGPRTVNQADLERFLREHRQQGGVPCEPEPIQSGKTRGRQLRVQR